MFIIREINKVNSIAPTNPCPSEGRIVQNQGFQLQQTLNLRHLSVTIYLSRESIPIGGSGSTQEKKRRHERFESAHSFGAFTIVISYGKRAIISLS